MAKRSLKGTVSQREAARNDATMTVLYFIHCYLVYRDGLTIKLALTNLAILLTFFLFSTLTWRGVKE